MKIIRIFLLIFALSVNALAETNNSNFDAWIKSFKVLAKDQGISTKTINTIMDKAKFLPNVIKYDRFQPEFYEDTATYINKRTSNSKVKKGINLYYKNNKLINNVENEFAVEKELLLSLMGIETNFGKYLGKMDIVSSLATLSFDKRRSVFFTNELLTLLKLIDQKIINPNTLFGSWAGAFGNFQFMPSTIKNYAINYDENKSIELKTINDSFASAANYINKIGWKNNEPCFIEISLKNNVPKKYLNTSAKKLKNKKKIKYFKKYIIGSDKLNQFDNFVVAIITPDKDIIPGSDDLTPAYIVFDNYELILKWNRSLRFGLAVCTLKEKFENEL